MGSCMNKSATAISKQGELHIPKHSDSNQQNTEFQAKVQTGAKRLTVFHEDQGETNQKELADFVKQSGNQQKEENNEQPNQEEVQSQPVPLAKVVTEQNQSSRRFSIQGAPAKVIQNSFEDKFVSLQGDIKDKPGQILAQMGVGISCKKGLKPESPNQDDFSLFVDGETAILGVFDGHGPVGHDVSAFVHKRLPENFINDPSYMKDPQIALKNAFIKTNQEVTSSNSKDAVDCSLSGTTATVVVRRQDKLYVAHVGDSRGILGKKASGKNSECKDLTKDHKPTLKEEKKRIYNSGGEVKRMEGDVPHRVFLRGKPFPGLSMSRAIGDTLAQSVGVIPEPEVNVFTLVKQDLFILLCSDGVWEFISSKEAAQMIYNYGKEKVSEATENLAQRAWGEWINNEGNTVDDITIICCWL